MAIHSVSVDTNGWTLAVTGGWSATSGAFDFAGADRTDGAFRSGAVDQFPLDANGAPKVVVRVKRQGFARLGDRSVEASVNDIQTIIATKPLRKPYPNQTELDEVDHGDGTRTVRLALSEYVYDGDEIVDVAFAAGWKAGEDGGLVASVANDSAAPLPVAISRVIQPGFELVRGTTRKTFEYLIVSHHPRHAGAELHQAVAGASVSITDGTHTVGPFWGQVGTSDRGDGLRCWRFACDLEGLDAGPVSVNFTSYPWVGQMRTTGSSHSTDTTIGLPLAWDAPHMVCYDPDADLYPHAFVYVDAATGTDVVANVTVADTLAAAKLGTPADSVKTAWAAIYAKKYTLPARNGWAATGGTARMFDWCQIVLAPGVQAWGNESVGLNSTVAEGRLVIRGDPDDPDPRTNVILRARDSGDGSGAREVKRFWFEDLTIEMGPVGWLTTTMLTHIENVECRGVAGYETSTAAPAIFNGDSPSGYALFSMSRSTWWKYGVSLTGTRQRFLLMRSCATSRACDAIVHVNGSKPDDGYSGRTGTAFGGWNTASTSVTDAIIWGCSGYDWRGEFAGVGGARVSGSGTLADPSIITRFAMVNTLGEGAAGRDGGVRFLRFGANPVQVSQSIIEGVTCVGYAANVFYDGGVDTANAAETVRLDHLYNRFANNAVARMAIKGDQFLSDGTLTGNWPQLYGVNYAANVHGNRTDSEASNFQYAFYGRNSLTDTDYGNVMTSGFFGFVDDKSGASGAGWGDYAPDEGSPLIDRGAVANIDVDAGGAVRGVVFSSGASVSEFDGQTPVVAGPVAPAVGFLELRGDALRVQAEVPVAVSAAGARHEVRDRGVSVQQSEALVAPRKTTVGLRSTMAGVRMTAGRMSVQHGRTIRVNRSDRVLRAGPD